MLLIAKQAHDFECQGLECMKDGTLRLNAFPDHASKRLRLLPAKTVQLPVQRLPNL
jgi:hypothetical protein